MGGCWNILYLTFYIPTPLMVFLSWRLGLHFSPAMPFFVFCCNILTTTGEGDYYSVACGALLLGVM
jgi:hypothetical protein